MMTSNHWILPAVALLLNSSFVMAHGAEPAMAHGSEPAMAHGAVSATAHSAAAATGHSHSASAGPDRDEIENWRLAKSIVYSWTAIVVLLMGYTFSLACIRYIRTSINASKEDQRYSAIPNRTYGLTKRYLLDAPLFRTRHHREFMLSSAINVGTLPNRLQTIFLTAYLVMAITLTTYGINWHGGKEIILEQILKRTGFMAIVNMLPLFLLAGRNNPLIAWTGVTFDTYNLIHRWLGRIVVLEAIAHGISWLVHKVDQGKSMGRIRPTFSLTFDRRLESCCSVRETQHLHPLGNNCEFCIPYTTLHPLIV
jgi:Ferric reductase like transmembrane component